MNDEFPVFKKESLNKKLIMYSVAAGMTLSLGAKAHAEIQYTNIDPEKTIAQVKLNSTNDFLLDLNNDGTPEFKIFQTYWYTTSSSYYYTGNSVRQTAINGGLSVMRETADNAYVATLSSNDLISASQNFNADKTLGGNSISSYDFVQTDGPWPGAGQKFMGVKFKIGENVHYGWIRLLVGNTCESFVVYDYAYEDESGKAIRAGQIDYSSHEDQE